MLGLEFAATLDNCGDDSLSNSCWITQYVVAWDSKHLVTKFLQIAISDAIVFPALLCEVMFTIYFNDKLQRDATKVNDIGRN